MKLNDTNCLICNCEGTMPLEEKPLAKALGIPSVDIHKNLCRSQLGKFEAALAQGESLLVACTQEAPLFQEIAEEHGAETSIDFVNIRENAGWSSDAAAAGAKIAALLKSAAYETKPARLKSIHSDGMCLVYGKGQQALEAAQILSQKLSVTLLLCGDEEFILPRISDVPIYRGTIQQARGSFGQFSLSVDNYAPLLPSSRSEMSFLLERDGAKSDCSVILDLSGNAPLFSGHAHRDGYKRVDAGDPAAVLRAVIDLSDMVGEFEKPIYVGYESSTCAHSRSLKTGCTKCLDVCPAGAIADAGDIIEIDSGICGGCGSCHAVCPTGSISYQYPVRSDLIGRAQMVLSAHRDAGGESPVLLFHDEPFGADLIGAMARYGRGLPANVIPLVMHSVTTLGHVEILSLVASGAAKIVLLGDPNKKDETEGLVREIALCDAIISGLELGDREFCSLLSTADPEVAEQFLWSLNEATSLTVDAFQPIGSKRDIARMAFGKLHAQSPGQPQIIALPAHAPYGRLEIDQSSCTLCMACTSACPSAAIVDTPGEPKLRFIETACVQCGLCVSTCPENALSLLPQLNFTPAAMQPVTLYEEEPFHCIVCDTPFATRSTIERISGQLSEKHSMFASAERGKLIQMCQDCRVEAQANTSEDPFASNARPRVRTTDDYIAAEKGDLTPDDFLIED